MPTANVGKAFSYSDSGSNVGVLINPAFIYVHDEPQDKDWVVLAPHRVAAGTSWGDSDSEAHIGLQHGLILVDSDEIDIDTAGVFVTTPLSASIVATSFPNDEIVMDLVHAGQRVGIIAISIPIDDDVATVGGLIIPNKANIILNPSVELGVDNWNVSGAGGTLSHETTEGWAGEASARVDLTATFGTDVLLIVSSASGIRTSTPDVWLSEIRVRGTASVSGVYLRARYTDATIQDSLNPLDAPFISLDWIDLVTLEILQDSSKILEALDIIITIERLGTADYLLADGAHIENVTDEGMIDFYVDGDQGEGFHWVAAPHASVSYFEEGS